MGRLRSLEKMTPKKAIFSTVLSKIEGFPERCRMRNAFVHGGRKKTIFRLNFSKLSPTTTVQILGIVRQHKEKTARQLIKLETVI